MTLIYTLTNQSGEVVYMTWDGASALMFNVDNPQFGKNCTYQYSSNLPSHRIAYIASEQQMSDYYARLSMYGTPSRGRR